MIRIGTAYSFGSGTSCPRIIYNKIEQSKDTVYLYAHHYFGSNFWPSLGCSNIDTVNIGIVPQSITAIKVVLKGIYIEPDDTTFMGIDSVLLTALDVKDVKNSKPKPVSLYPNPAYGRLYLNTDIKYNRVVISDMQGRRLIVIDSAMKVIDINSLPKGIYFNC